jgi:uncharacterized protein YbjQ (UPF0145 family)
MELEPLPEGAPSGRYADPSGDKTARYWDGVRWTEQARDDVAARRPPSPSELQEQQRMAASLRRDVGRWNSVVVTTSHELPNARIEQHVREVFGITVRTRNAFSNAVAGVRGVVGGEVASYTKLMLAARAEAIERLRREADAVGANAVISMRLDANLISDLMTEFVAYGAAVIIVPDDAEQISAPVDSLSADVHDER